MTNKLVALLVLLWQPQHRELHALLFSNSVWVLFPHWTLNIEDNLLWDTGPTVYSPYPRRLESLTIWWCNYKGSTFSSVILRPWVLVRPELNSQPPAWQPDAQPTDLEPPVRSVLMLLPVGLLSFHCLWLIMMLFSENKYNYYTRPKLFTISVKLMST